MKPFSPWFPLVIVLGSFTASAWGLSLPVSMDTSTTMKGNVAVVTTASGKATTLAVSPTQDALVLFDLGGLPPAFTAANVVGARLRLYVAAVTKSGDLGIQAALAAWDEAADGPAPTTQDIGIPEVLAAKVVKKRFIIVDVTATVKDWLSTPANNYGLAIIAAGATPTLKATLGAKEGPGIGQPAELEIDINAAGAVYENADPATGKLDGQKIGNSTVGNTQLANPSLTVTAGTGMTGGGAVALGGTVTLDNAGVTSLTGGGGVTVSAANGAVTLGSNATTANTPDTIVLRDGSGNANVNATVSGTYGSAVSFTNSANSFTGALTGTADSNLQGNILKNPALGMLLYHASFAGALVTANNYPGAATYDGFVSFSVSPSESSFYDLRGNDSATGAMLPFPLDGPGTFISVRAGWQQFTPVAGHSFYVVAGSGPGDATPTEGFGFKGLSSGLKGVTLQNGIETEVDLSTPMPVDIFFNLLAIRRTSSVEFFVNGIFKGSSSTNLPAVSRNGYVVRASNDGTAPMPANVSVGFLTIGIPMF